MSKLENARAPVQPAKWFFLAMAAAVAGMVVAGFANTYYFRDPDLGPLPALFQIHGAAFTAWFALFITQASLVRADALTLHRLLGLASLPLAVALVILGWEGGIDAYRRGVAITEGGPPATFFFLSASDAVGFAALYGSAIALRRRGDVHKRLMLLASISLIVPATARLAMALGVSGVAGAFLQFAFVGAVLAHDAITLRRMHPATVIGAGVIALKFAALLIFAPTPMWENFSRWVAA